MLIKDIRIIDEITDIENDSIDVSIDCEDGSNFIVSIATTKFLLERMDIEKTNFSKPNDLCIVVRKLTQEIITETLQAYAEDDAFWLKLHHFASDIDISVFDELQAKRVKESILFSGLDDLETEIDKLDKLNDAEKSNLAAKIEKLGELFY